MRIVSCTAELPTAADNDLIWVDYSTLAAIEACPTKGIVRYVAKKWPYAGTDDVATSAGTAFHLMCAVWNACQMNKLAEIESLINDQSLSDAILETAGQAHIAGGDFATTAAVTALYEASGFYDSDTDKKRTLANIELAFINQWLPNQNGDDWYPPLAVEVPIEYVLTIVYDDELGSEHQIKLKYRGRIDKVCKGHTGILPVDYKTTALTLGPSYAAGFGLSHQLTGYNIGLGLLYEDVSPYGMIEAVKLPPSKNKDVNSYFKHSFKTNVRAFAEFVVNNYKFIEMYNAHGDITEIERRNSCNAYFRKCALLDNLCTLEVDERNEVLKSFEDVDWDPHATR